MSKARPSGWDKIREWFFRLRARLTASRRYAARPGLSELLDDPRVHAELRLAWYASNPNAPDVRIGQPGSPKREHGGFIYWDPRSGRLIVQRVKAGSRDGLPPGLPPPASADLELVGSFHTHPNTVSEGYVSDPSPADRTFTRDVSRVPEIVETHEGRKSIPYP